ncbi:rho GTPase-activating protein conundrum-like isoform X2 [Daphnia pulicaria]|uniref:rho GTPase-activating protein conundrum-like isoform X2 n=1 Tax=Daphnia pulicaria TaxID=35523 RepID=UPI001EEA9C54|nr:rho GTPase-activating protein conundrum-like isoform X2 [Daphnia pulicaria]
MAAVVEGEAHLHDVWPENHVRSMVETTSSEDELLCSASTMEAEEAATWLIDVGLGNIVDNLMENNQLVTEASLANAVIEDNLTTNQYQTIRKRVETLRVTLKGRKTRAGAGQQRPDCRDIFRDPEASHSGGSSGRSRSATPDSLDSDSMKHSTENLVASVGGGGRLTISPAISPKTWSRSGSQEDGELLSSLFQSSCLDEDDAATISSNNNKIFHLDSFLPIPNTHRSEARRRSSFNQIDGIKQQSFKPSRPGFFSPAAEGHVAAVDRQGIEIVKFKLVGTLSSASAYSQRRHSDQYGDVTQLIPVTQQPKISLEEGLTHAQKRKLRQLALLELTALFDKYGLPMRKRSRLRVRNFTQSSRERNVFGIPLKKLVEKDQARTPIIFTMLVEELRNHRLDEEGLLRVPGNKQKMLVMQNVIENQWKNNHVDIKGMQIVTHILKSSGSHEIACLLKTYLRQLPESLFTQDCLDLFAQVGDITNFDDQIWALNLLIVQLPDVNCQTLRLLLRFLKDVVDHQTQNRMTVSNVATVMGPNLFPPRISKASTKTNMESLTDGMAYASKTNRITEILVTHQDELFSIPPEMLLQLSRIKVK